MRIVHFSTRRPVTILVFFIAAVVFGLGAAVFVDYWKGSASA